MENKIRVAAYCRISTDKEIQQSSLEIQTKAFERIIYANPDWELVKIYADEGLSGTTAKSRVQFQKMINDALNGEIDYILAKSISRFARNTVDALNYTRMLKEKGIGVYFEEQSLDTLSVASEIFLTIHAAFAQEESHSISENQKRGFRNRFELGIPKYTLTFGFKKAKDESWVVVPNEARVIRIIFDMCEEGKSLPEISKFLQSRGFKPPVGEKKWYEHSIAAMLHNEKYIGDVEMQKTYVADHLTHKKLFNDGKILPKHYVRDHHPAIISREQYSLVQRILDMKNTHKGSTQYPYYGILKCPCCGENMVGFAMKTHGLERAWTCGGKAGSGETRKERSECIPVCVKEKYIHDAVKRAFVSKGIKADTIEYYQLEKRVESITFQKGNWYTLIVRWKNGTETAVSIDYQKTNEIPVESMKIKEGYVYFDDHLIGDGYYDFKAITTIENIRAYIDEIRITETEGVPVVLTLRTSKESKNESKKNRTKAAV